MARLFNRFRLPRSLMARILVAAGVWMSMVLLAGGFMLSLLYQDTVKSNFDNRLSILLDSLVGISTTTAGGGIALTRIMADPRFDEPYSGWYWQISEKGQQPYRSRSLWDLDLHIGQAGNLTKAHYYNGLGPENQNLRVIERDIILPDSERSFRFMVAVDRSEIGEAVHQFNQTLLIWLASLGAGLIAAMIIQVRYGLYPLRRMLTSLARIRNGKQARFEDNFPNEIMPLISELNALIEHNEAVVERAKTHVGNLAHALKTPLTVLNNEASLSPPSILAETVLKQTQAMSRQVNHHLARARAAARGNVIGSRAPLAPAIADLQRALERIYADRHLAIQSEGIKEAEAAQGVAARPETTAKNQVKGKAAPVLAFRGERQDLDEMLGNLMDNACKWANSQVLVRVSTSRDWIEVTVEDDGPGIVPEAREQVFGRGERADLSVPGTGLGLAIVRDIAELCGGRIELASSSLGGLKAVLTLPLAK